MTVWLWINYISAAVNVVLFVANAIVLRRWRREDAKLAPQSKRERALWTAGFNEGRIAERRSGRIR